MKFEFSRKIFEKFLHIKFHENPSSGSRVVPCGRTDGRTGGQTDMTKLIVAFRNFAKALKNPLWLFSLLEYRIRISRKLRQNWTRISRNQADIPLKVPLHQPTWFQYSSSRLRAPLKGWCLWIFLFL